MIEKNVAMLVGSLRCKSYSRSLAPALARSAPPSLKLQEVESGRLDFYNEDLEVAAPQAWVEPELYVSRVNELLDEHGSVVNADSSELLPEFMEAFALWVAANNDTRA